MAKRNLDNKDLLNLVGQTEENPFESTKKNTSEEVKETVEQKIIDKPVEHKIVERKPIAKQEITKKATTAAQAHDLEIFRHTYKLKDIQVILDEAINTRGGAKMINSLIAMDEATNARMNYILEALSQTDIPTTKLKRPLLQKLLVDFFWNYFKEDVVSNLKKKAEESKSYL